MRSIPHPVFAHAVLIGASLILVGCGASDRDELTERLEKGIAPEHSTDPAERRAVAESLAADVRALQADARQYAASDAGAAAAEARADAARAALIEADCAQMRLEVEVLQRRPEADPAATQIEIESLQNRISQNCR